MTEVGVLLSTDDLLVLGPPNNIDLAVSIGQQGVRGAKFFAGPGNPNDSSISQDLFGSTVVPVEGDIFINYSSGSQYGWLYIYNPKGTAIDDWDEVVRLQPPTYAKRVESIFSAGSATVSIPVSSILPAGVSESNTENYIVNVSANSSSPISMSVSSKSLVSGALQIVFSGAKCDTGTYLWSALNETVDIDINIYVSQE
jgi:hypothetical protein